MIKHKEYLIYAGKRYSIEWYYNATGRSQAFAYYQQLTQPERIQFLKLVKRFGDCGSIKDRRKFNYEGDKVYAFKPQPDRFLCFFHSGHKIIVTNAFRKKTQKVPINEKIRALQALLDYQRRLKQGVYYDEKETIDV